MMYRTSKFKPRKYLKLELSINNMILVVSFVKQGQTKQKTKTTEVNHRIKK